MWTCLPWPACGGQGTTHRTQLSFRHVDLGNQTQAWQPTTSPRDPCPGLPTPPLLPTEAETYQAQSLLLITRLTTTDSHSHPASVQVIFMWGQRLSSQGLSIPHPPYFCSAFPQNVRSVESITQAEKPSDLEKFKPANALTS